MASTAEILTTIEEQKIYDIKQLAKKLATPLNQLKEILTDLSQHNLIEYNPKTGKVTLPTWLINLNKQIETIKPATGAIILPKYQEIKIQDALNINDHFLKSY